METGSKSQGLAPLCQRLDALRIKCERIKKYLTTGTHIKGLSQNQQRTVREQALVHGWDAKKRQWFLRSGPGGVMKRLVTSEEEVLDILRHHHSNAMGGHSGVNTTLYKISMLYTWNGMKGDVKEYINSCDRCQRFSTIKTQAPKMIPIKVKVPLELVGMDLIGPLPVSQNGNKYVCTFTDYFTKFVDFFPLKEKAAAGVAKSIKSFVCRWGAPERLLSDQGREFVAKINDEVCALFGIKRSVTSAYHPQTNGLDERTNQTLKVRLSKLVNENQDNWDSFLEEVAYSIRTQKQGSTKFTPFFLMFNRHPRDTRELSVANDNDVISEVSEEDKEEMVTNRETSAAQTYQKVQSNVEYAQEKQKKAFQNRKSKCIRTFDFAVGDLVLRRQMKNVSRKGGKMEPLWIGPYRILEMDTKQRFTLQSTKKDVPLMKTKIPHNQLRPYLQSVGPTTQATESTTQAIQEIESTIQEETESSPNESESTTQAIQETESTIQEETESTTQEKTEPNAQHAELTTQHAEPTTQLPTNFIELLPDIQELEFNKDKTDEGQCPPKERKRQCTRRAPATLCQSLKTAGFWLTDEHIDHAQNLLAPAFSSVDGLQSVCVYETQCYWKVVACTKPFIQVINTGSHWVTLSNVLSESTNQIQVFDSLKGSCSHDDVPSKLKNQVAATLKTDKPSFSLRWADIKLQVGSSDCGLFAIACATSICYGLPPQEQDWDQNLMREHLVKCFLAGYTSPFPIKNTRIHGGFGNDVAIEVYCHCRRPYTGTFMIECSRCCDWFHRTCDIIPARVTPDTIFICRKCR